MRKGEAMKVSVLIERLRACDPDAVVRVVDGELCEWQPVTGFVFEDRGGFVDLYCDVDEESDA